MLGHSEVERHLAKLSFDNGIFSVMKGTLLSEVETWPTKIAEPTPH